jgi:hypothetical protein
MSPQLSAVKPGQKPWMTGPLVNPGEKTELKSSPLVQKSGSPYP